MRAVKCKNGHLSLISRSEAALFNNAEFKGFLSLNSLNERDQHLAEELYKRNVLRKIKRGDDIGYKIHPQKEQI